MQSTRSTDEGSRREQRLLARCKRTLLGALATALTCSSGWSQTPTTSAAVSEYAVKAAVLLKVAKFVDWPSDTFARESSTLVICIVGRQATLPAFESLEANQLGTHRIDVRLVTGDMLDLRQCQIAFFPSDSGADIDYALSKLEGTPVLTVGESEAFARRGGMLALVTREQRVRFAVNLAASKRGGITISSQLLNLATLVEERKR